MKVLKFDNVNNTGPKAYLISRQLGILITKYDRHLVYSRLYNWRSGDTMVFSVVNNDMLNVHLNNLIATYSKALLLKVWDDIYG